MFKGRIGLWVIMLAVTLLVSWLIPIVPGWFDSNTIYVEVDMSSDAEFAQTIANQKIKKIRKIEKIKKSGNLKICLV